MWREDGLSASERAVPRTRRRDVSHESRAEHLWRFTCSSLAVAPLATRTFPMQRPSSAHTITPFNKQQQQQRPSTAFIRTLSSAVTGSASASATSTPTGLCAPDAKPLDAAAPRADGVHAALPAAPSRPQPRSGERWPLAARRADGLRPPRTADTPGLRAAQRGSHSQMKTRGVANSVASAALAGSQSTPQILQLAVVSDYGDEEVS